MLLRDILYKVAIRSVTGSTEVDINDVQIDSRKVKPGSLFVAVRGVATDGHQFIEKATESGAITVVCETMPAVLKEGATANAFKNLAESLARHIAIRNANFTQTKKGDLKV